MSTNYIWGSIWITKSKKSQRDQCGKINTDRGRQMDTWLHTPLTRFSGLCSSWVVEAQRVMRDLNMQPTTTASMFCATDLLSPVVKLFPKPALSGSNSESGETTDHTGGGLVTGVGQHLWQLTSLSLNIEPKQQGRNGGHVGQRKRFIKHMGEKQTEKDFG